MSATIPTARARTAVITGASSGIGHACVLRMVNAGWRVFATVRKTQDGDRLQSEIGSAVTPVIMDLQNEGSIRVAADQVSAQVDGRGIDGLVNVAGIGMVQPVEYVKPEDLQEIFDINVFGQIAVTQAFLSLIRRARGRIVNITSVGAHIALPFGGLLNASKSAFGVFSDTLRLELRPFGIRVCAIEPGAIKTPAVDKTLGNVDAFIRSLPSRGAEEYGPMLKTFAQRAYEREMNGSSPDVVAKSVHHALTAKKPRIRYCVGKDAKVLVTLPRILPDWFLDIVRFRFLGLPSQFGAALHG